MSARITGVQAALVAFAALLDAWKRQFSPREYAVLIDLLSRRLDRELDQQQGARGRWVA